MPNRVPTAVLEARGAFQNHPERRREREHEPKPSGSIGNAPKHFTPDQKKLWREFLKIVPPGVLFNSDRWMLETIVLLKSKERQGTLGDSARAQLINCYSKLGMTPSDRTKVQAQPQPKTDRKPKTAWDMLENQNATTQ